jgi:hypothetical protein
MGDGPKCVLRQPRSASWWWAAFGLYIVVAQPFSDNRTLANTIISSLLTTLAAITAFYFGTRVATVSSEQLVRGPACRRSRLTSLRRIASTRMSARVTASRARSRLSMQPFAPVNR